MKRFTMTVAMVAVLCGTVMATLAPWPVQKEYYGVLAHWRFNDNQVAGAVAQYKLDDNAASTTVVNAKGGTNGTWGHGNTSAHTAASWCSNFTTALEFDGANDYINTGQAFQTTFRDSFSISMWVQIHDGVPSGDNYFVSSSGSNGSFFYASIIAGGGLDILYCDGSNWAEWWQSGAVDGIFKNGENNWHNLVIVVESGVAIRVYVDGVEIEGTPDNGVVADMSGVTMSNYTTSRNALIGAFDPGSGNPNAFFDGRMDNVAIYPRVLTAEDVAFIASCGTQNTETDVTTVVGSDPAGKNLTLPSGVSVKDLTTETGQIGRCFTFDGTNDWLSTQSSGQDNNDGTYDFNTQKDFSASVWVKTTSTSNGRILFKKNATGTTRGFFLSTYTSGNDHVVKFQVGDGTTYIDTVSSNSVNITDGNWHHVVAVRTHSAAPKVYIDGALSGTGTSDSYDLTTTSTNALHVGCDVNHNYKFTGSLDDLIIFNRALTATEVDNLYDRGMQEEYTREMSNPEDDWRYWEDMRMFIWETRYSISSYPNEFANLDLSEFQTGGSEANRAYGIGLLYLGYNGEIYVNKVAKAVNTPLSSGLNPSTSGDWYVAASLADYGNWDKMQERWFYDGQSWEHGHAFLPPQVNPYCQSAGTKYLDGVQLPASSTVALTDEIKQEYADAFESALVAAESEEMVSPPTDLFKTWWAAVVGDTYDIGSDGALQNLDSEFFGCNGSVLEFILSESGSSSYKWVLVTTHPTSEASPDWLAFHPQWWDTTLNGGAGGWHLWSESADGYIQAVWRRIPLFKESSYSHSSTGQVKYWMGDASQEPPGLQGKTLRDRYIRCAVDGNGNPLPNTSVSGTNSKRLSQVESDYDSQYGYWDGTWHNGSVTYDGSQMYATVESTSNGVFTAEETRAMPSSIIPSDIRVGRNFQGIGYSVAFEQRTMGAGTFATTMPVNTAWESLFSAYVGEHWATRVLNPNLSPWFDSGCTAENEGVNIEAHTTYTLNQDDYRWATPYFSSYAVTATALTARLTTTAAAIDDHGDLVSLTGGDLSVAYHLGSGGDRPNQAYVYHHGDHGSGFDIGDIEIGQQILNGDDYFVVDVPCLVLSYYPKFHDDNGDPIYPSNYPWAVFSASNTWSVPQTYSGGVNYTAQDTGMRQSYGLTKGFYRHDHPYKENPSIGLPPITPMSATDPGATGYMDTKDYNVGRASSVGSGPIYTVR